MNIFFRELRVYRKSLIIWSVSIFLVIISSIGKFTAYSQSGQSINELFSQIPSSIRAVLGMGNFDLTTISGFYGMLYLYLLLLAAIHACLLGAGIISKEERDKTTEFLLVKPVSRTVIITAKLFASLFNVVVFNLVTLVLSIVLMSEYSNGESITGEICLLMAGMFFVQLIFLFIGTATASVSRHPRSAPSVATAILLLTFILSSVISINSALENLKYITPFEYFKAERLLDGQGFDAVFLILSAVIVAVLAVVTYTSYKKRDMNI